MTENEKIIIKDTLIKVRDYIIYNGLNKREGGICDVLSSFKIRHTISCDEHKYCIMFMRKILNASLTRYLWPPGEVTPRVNWLNKMIYEELETINVCIGCNIQHIDNHSDRMICIVCNKHF